MKTAVHGMGRIGARRALKWALEAYWSGRTTAEDLEATAMAVRRANWQRLSEARIDVIPSNDFSLYDHVLDAAVAVGAVPERFGPAADGASGLDRYFAMPRGARHGGAAAAPLELTKWFDTNYHHLVPEIDPEAAFAPDPTKLLAELTEAADLGLSTIPALLGPFTLLLRSTSSAHGVRPLDRLDELVEVYLELLAALAGSGATWVRLDEPALVEDRTPAELAAFTSAYERLGQATAHPRLWLSTYFGHVGEAMAVLCDLPIDAVGLDFCAGGKNLDLLADAGGLGGRTLFAGVVDGRNVWANDLDASLGLLEQLGEWCGELVVSSSCSFLHVPDSLAEEVGLDPAIRPWIAFAQEKLAELGALARGAAEGREAIAETLEANARVKTSRRCSTFVTDAAVRRAVAAAPSDPRRAAPLSERRALQQTRLSLPPLPTTTIGSFPQTSELRTLRARWRAGRTSDDTYEAALRAEVDRVVALQENLDLDVIVHGEAERDDMVRYFAAQLRGFALPAEGWVQSYGSRCVRPPILFGDVSRPAPMTLRWTTYAQSRTKRPMKGMLTGPITMLRWSFVRDDQRLAETAIQVGLAIGEELRDLESAGVAVVQVDEPALREGMPLRQKERADYLAWATRAFRLVAGAAAPATQVHTHMCYAELTEVLDALEELEVDVVSFEAARSHMALLGALGGSSYHGDVGPGVYDVHSPLIPASAEVEALLRRALDAVGPERLWVNPDCGLKTRSYAEVTAALSHLVTAARTVRAGLEAGQGGPPGRGAEPDGADVAGRTGTSRRP